jgi:membrane protease YdiL (CAAX protease family)
MEIALHKQKWDAWQYAAVSAYLLLPLVLWPISFIVLKQYFAYAMLVSSLILALFTFAIFKRIEFVKSGHSAISAIALGAAGAVALYFVFIGGAYALHYLGFYAGVQSVYAMVYSQGTGIVLAFGLGLIGIFEEVYWRYGLQRLFGSAGGRIARYSWIAAALFYGAVHLLTLNLVLAGAALVVGLATSWIASRRGILASIITHIVWIEMIILIFPPRL